MDRLSSLRLSAWCQDGTHRVENPEVAQGFIDRVGIATLYGASPEFPSLYQAYMSDPTPPTFATWDSPSGHVYTWRWEIGKPHRCFYGTVVAKKPTWVSFDVLPILLGALAERRSTAELFEAGELSRDALQVAQAFVGTDGVLSTAELRDRAGFPKGKESRAAYLKAVEELDSRLFLAKRFAGDEGSEDSMSHAWIATHYADLHRDGFRLDPDEALSQLLGRLLPTSIYFDPKPLARHLRVSPKRLEGAFGRLADDGRIRPFEKIWVTTQEEN